MLLDFTSFFFWAFSSVVTGPGIIEVEVPSTFAIVREIDKDKTINLVSEQGEVQEIAEPLNDDDDATLAKTLLNIKRSTTKDKRKEVIKSFGFNLQQKGSKKQKLDEQTEEEIEAQVDTDQEIEEMKLYVKIVRDEDIAINAIPLAIKPLAIVEYKIVKEGNISTYHIIRADGNKHGNTRPEEDYERVLWGDIKVMFEPDIESEVWRQLHGYDVIAWKLFSSSRVHFVGFKNLYIFMLVDKINPPTPATITKILERKLQADQWNEMCYQLLKLMLKQQRKR
uniref:Uncharacterized protein n=1 Tax=Tanacetum cinerariifolium TaxID=118510 RepID=A0A699IMT9_TANCI|nr:hypothetical protein [Tanacetum cinerariifolium]